MIKMSLIYTVDASELVEKTSRELKNIAEIKPPEWATFVKTGAHKERPPVNKGWWYIRAASILLSIARLGPIGVSKLRTKYGGKKNRGHQPEKFFRGSGSIIRKILQQLDTAGLTKKVEKGLRKGRILTPKGVKLLNGAANKIKGAKPKKIEAPAVEKKKSEKELKKDIKKDEKTIEKLDKIEGKKQDKVKKLVKEEVKLVKEEKKLEKDIKKQEEKTERIVEEKIKEKDEKVKKLEKEEAKVIKKEGKLEQEIKKEEAAIEHIDEEKEKAEEDEKQKKVELKKPETQVPATEELLKKKETAEKNG